MQQKQFTLTILVLLVAFGFLAAQFHFCADLGSGPAGSHLCPICSHAGTAISAHSPGIVHVPIVDRFEARPLIVASSSAVPRATSPRAPPAL